MKMRKILALTLTFIMIISTLAISAFALPTAVDVTEAFGNHTNNRLGNTILSSDIDLSMLYIDISDVVDTEKTIDGVWLWTFDNIIISNKPMIQVEEYVFSYDISEAVAGGDTNAKFSIFYTDGVNEEIIYSDNFESGKNLWKCTSIGTGTWSVYEPKQLFSGGKGTEAEPYLISSVDDLLEMAQMIEADTDATLDASDDCGLAQFHGYYFKQTADIDLSQINWTPFNFCGVYDGDGHKITNMTVSERRYSSTDVETGEVESNEYEAAFFGQLVHAEIMNLTFENCAASISETLTPDSGRDIYVAIAASTAIASRFENVKVVNSTVSQNALEGNFGYAGGLVGYADICNFTNCSFEGGSIVMGGSAGSESVAGGIVGGIGDIYFEYIDYYNMAVGAGEEFGIFNSSVKTNISVNDAASGKAGGIAGATFTDFLSHTFKNCYFEGDLTAGLVCCINGWGSSSDIIKNCFVNAGALASSGTANTYAIAQHGEITDCVFYAEDTTNVQGTDGVLYTKEQLSSGEVAYLLQGEQTELVWGQSIGTDEYPVLGGETVYFDNSIYFNKTYITIALGKRADETNIRYAEIDGIVTEITEDNDTYTVKIGKDNLLVEVVEKTSDGTVVKAQYFFVDMTEKTASKLEMDSYIHTYDETGIRVKEPTGIRFKAHILTSAKEEESAFIIDEYGYVLTRADVLGDEELTLDTELIVTGVGYNRFDGTDIVYNGDDEKHIFTGVLKNIPVEHYKTDIVCKTYTKISVGDDQFILYGEAVTGNVYDTATKLLETEPDNAALTELILAYENAIGIPGDDLYE